MRERIVANQRRISVGEPPSQRLRLDQPSSSSSSSSSPSTLSSSNSSSSSSSSALSSSSSSQSSSSSANPAQRSRLETTTQSMNLEEIASEVRYNHQFSIKISVIVYGCPRRTKIVCNGYTGPCVGSTLDDLKKNIFNFSRSHIRGTAVKYADGRTSLDPIKEEDGYDQFHGHIKLRRRILQTLESYSELEATNDKTKNVTISVCVYIYGIHCDSDTFEKLSSAATANADRSGAPDNAKIDEVSLKIQQKYGHQYDALAVDWGTWAGYAIRMSRGREDLLDEFIEKGRPEHLSHLFHRPGSAPARAVLEMRRGASSFVRMIEGMIREEKEFHRRKMQTLNHYKEFYSALREDELLRPEENDVSDEFLRSILNHVDDDHIEE
jgi:hypothetical protein